MQFTNAYNIIEGDYTVNWYDYYDDWNDIIGEVISTDNPFENVEEMIGHAAGGVCPFGINDNVLVYLDKSLKQYEYIYPACGTSNTAVKLLISELELSSKYVKWVDVCK